jgi:YD repeat-containing protein
MWTVSTAFLDALPAPHRLTTTVTVTPPGGSPTTLGFVNGSVKVSGSQLTRRTADLVVDGGSATYDLLSTPGSVVTVMHGVEYLWGDPELVPVITGELSGAAQTLGDGTVAVNVADFWQRVDARDFTSAYSPNTATSRVSEITSQITTAVPGTTVTNLSTDTGTVATAQTWDSRSNLIKQLATDGGLETFFTPDGNFTIRNEAQVTDSPVWVVEPGVGGNLKTLERQRPLDKVYNTVIVTPSSLDGAQTWAVQTAAITDPAHPRYPGKIGVRPYKWEARSTMTASQALTAALILLNRTLGSTETLRLGTLSNPALEAGDVLTVVNIIDGGLQTVTRIIDGFSLDLAAGDMTIDTRSSVEAV